MSKIAVRRDSAAKSHIGEAFGRLVIKDIKRLERGTYYMVCSCSCGGHTSTPYYALTSGKSQSCGCLHKELTKAKSSQLYKSINKARIARAESHIHETYGKLTIIGVERRSRYNFMLCLCACGNKTSVRYALLKSGNTKSCGCYQKQKASESGQKSGAHNSTKGTVRFGWNFNGTRMRSGFEVMFANALHQKGTEFQYEPKCFIISSQSRYTPDFFVPSENCYYEIKGRANPAQQAKIEFLRQEGIDIRIIFQPEVEKAIGTTYQRFKSQWCKANSIPLSA
jgi:hypothetical protein